MMTYTSREVTGILGITYSQLLNFVHMSKPDDWTFTKVAIVTGKQIGRAHV